MVRMTATKTQGVRNAEAKEKALKGDKLRRYFAKKEKTVKTAEEAVLKRLGRVSVDLRKTEQKLGELNDKLRRTRGDERRPLMNERDSLSAKLKRLKLLRDQFEEMEIQVAHASSKISRRKRAKTSASIKKARGNLKP